MVKQTCKVTMLPSHDSAPKKRARTQTTVLDSSEWKRHPDLYMPDGTLVVLANNTVFKVYSGLLSKHSEVFSGMVSLSNHQPSDAETYDGCLVVRLTDDPEDLAYFFEATMSYNLIVRHFSHKEPTSYRIAAGLLRLATKYMVTPLRRRAINHFSRVIPNNIVEIGKKESFKKVFGNDVPHPFALVTLFRECQLAQFLPWAFYISCEEGLSKLISGAPHDGQVIQLSTDDIVTAVLGWVRLRDENLHNRRMTVVSRAHDKRGTCDTAMRNHWLNSAFVDLGCNAMEQWDALTSLLKLDCITTTKLSSAFIPCSHCIDAWRAKDEVLREKAWKKLPQVFELAPWADLQRDVRDHTSN